MQINLSSQPLIIDGPNVRLAVTSALAKAQTHFGTSLPSMENDSPEALNKCMENLFAIAISASESGLCASAATAILILAYDGFVMLPVHMPPLRSVTPPEYPFALPKLF